MPHRGRRPKVRRGGGREDAESDPRLSAVPFHRLAVLPSTHSPLASLRENVVLSALVAKYAAERHEESTAIALPPQCQAQFHILIDCASSSSTLLPHCYSTVVFATAFIDEILEQQAQSNFVVVRWPGAAEDMGIAGRLLRPETYHYSMAASQFETVYRAVFEGRSFVRVTDWQQLDLRLSTVGVTPPPRSNTPNRLQPRHRWRCAWRRRCIRSGSCKWDSLLPSLRSTTS